MTEPLFFDCLTDAQCWSLFEAGVLQDAMLPVEVYQRLERLAPDHGCYLFTWPTGLEPPSLQELVPDLAPSGEEMPALSPSRGPEGHPIAERIQAVLAAFRARVHPDRQTTGGQIHVVALLPRPELRAGPRLAPPMRDLSAMSLAELEAYLDAALRLDEEDDAEGKDADAP
jgi:hypothetical protein